MYPGKVGLNLDLSRVETIAEHLEVDFYEFHNRMNMLPHLRIVELACSAVTLS